MADETSISTPAESFETDTSVNAEPDNMDTSVTEPEKNNETAETETSTSTQNGEGDTETPLKAQELYAGKYKTVEDLVKGYTESQKFVQKASELEKKLQSLEQEKLQAEQKAQNEALRQAQQRGFSSVEAQEIADNIQIAELEYYTSNLHLVHPEYYETCRNALANYYSTGNKAFLDDAKKFYSTDFIEQATLAKLNLKNKLENDYQGKLRAFQAQNEQKLAESIKSEYGDFLGSIKENAPISKALELFCNSGLIQSTDDMKVFTELVAQIQEVYKDQAIKEYKAKKAINETKDKAAIEAAATVNDKTRYTVKDVPNMTQKQFDDYCKKHGTDWLYR